MGDAIPIWADGAFTPVRVMLIRGRSELLSGMGIIKKVDSTVNFGRNQCKVGKSEWKMMAFSEKHHCVFPLAPTSCAYTKLNEYFGKLRGLGIEDLQVQGDFGGNLSVREVLRKKHQRLPSKMKRRKTAISDMGDMIRNTLLRVVNAISDCSGGCGAW